MRACRPRRPWPGTRRSTACPCWTRRAKRPWWKRTLRRWPGTKRPWPHIMKISCATTWRFPALCSRRFWGAARWLTRAWRARSATLRCAGCSPTRGPWALRRGQTCFARWKTARPNMACCRLKTAAWATFRKCWTFAFPTRSCACVMCTTCRWAKTCWACRAPRWAM